MGQVRESEVGMTLGPEALKIRLEDYLNHWAQITPDAPAVVDSQVRLTYAQLQSRVQQCARWMAGAGVQDGACIAVLATPSVDFWVSFLAAATVGATWLGLNPKYTRAELQHVLADAKPRLVLAQSEVGQRSFVEDLRALRSHPDTACSDYWLFGHQANAEDFPVVGEAESVLGAPPRARNPMAMYVYTSGTTGRPKAARLSHRALIRAAAVRASAWPVEPLRTLNNLPINHVGSTGDLACMTLVAGGCQVCLERFSPDATLRALEREQITFWYQVPTMFQMCLDAAAAGMDWSHLQAAVWSGGRATPELGRRLAQVARRVAVDYSMTESVGAITLSPLTADVALLDDVVGWPDSGRGVRVVDPETLEPTPPGHAGEVQLRDPWMFDGYREAEAGAEAYTADGWFRTGDLASRREDGAWRLVGRSREMFKSGGYNVYPREVEQVLESHPAVASVAVVETADPLYGEVGVAFVVPRSTQLDATMLEQHARAQLANYKVPKRFVLTEALPMLPIGKVDKQVLRRLAVPTHPAP